MQGIAKASPLYHGVQLVRGLTVGDPAEAAVALMHVTYLVVLLMAGFVAALYTFRRKLQA